MFKIYFGNVYSKVDKSLAKREELITIHELLSVKVPGHWFSKKYRHGMWDGQKKFFNLLTLQFYSGLLDVVKNKLQEENIEYEIVSTCQPQRSCDCPIQLNGYPLREYQEKMVHDALVAERGIICAPPNAGKTIIAAGLIQSIGHNAVFLTHRIGLMKQTQERFEQALQKEMGIFGGGERKFINEPGAANIMSVQSVHKSLDDPEIKEVLQNAHIVIVDEVHHASSKTFSACLQKCINAKWRYGLSATPQLRDPISNMLVLGLTGKMIVSVTNEEMIEAGFSALPSLYLLSANEPVIPSHYTWDQTYDAGIMSNTYRNSSIVSAAQHFLGEGKSVFILVWRIQHGNILKEMLKEKGIDCEFISGEDTAVDKKMGTSMAQLALKEFSKKKLKCLISSTISDEGIDVPAMDVLIISTGFKSPLKSIQRVGRALRKKIIGPNVVAIVDFMDFQNRTYLLKHSMDRLRAYDKMGLKMFEVSENNWSQVKELE